MNLSQNVLDIHSEFETEITSYRMNNLRKAVRTVKIQTDAVVLFEMISLIVMSNPLKADPLKRLLAQLKTKIKSLS